MEAKTALDKGMENETFRSQPVAYLLKASVYAGLAAIPSLSQQHAAYREEAYGAFIKGNGTRHGIT